MHEAEAGGAERLGMICWSLSIKGKYYTFFPAGAVSQGRGLPIVYNVSSYLEKPTEQEIGMK